MYRPIKLANGNTEIEEYLLALIHEKSPTAIEWRQQWIYAMRRFEDRLDKFFQNEVYKWGEGTVYEWMMEHEISKILALLYLDQCGIEDMSKLMRAIVDYAIVQEHQGQGPGKFRG